MGRETLIFKYLLYFLEEGDGQPASQPASQPARPPPSPTPPMPLILHLQRRWLCAVPSRLGSPLPSLVNVVPLLRSRHRAVSSGGVGTSSSASSAVVPIESGTGDAPSWCDGFRSASSATCCPRRGLSKTFSASHRTTLRRTALHRAVARRMVSPHQAAAMRETGAQCKAARGTASMLALVSLVQFWL